MVTLSKDMHGGDDDADSIFQLPSKQRRMIPIVAPQRHSSDNTSVSVRPIETATTVRPVTQKVPNPIQTTSPYALLPYDEQDGVVDKAVRGTHLDPKLDIYSPKYIPLWLRAVNDSPANHNRYARPLQTLDFNSYIASFAGSNFIRGVPWVQPPNVAVTEVSETVLLLHRYEQYWSQRLQNELALRSLENQLFSLYSHTLTVYEPLEQLYLLHIPGLRENAPRLDLGDVVHVRPLIAHIPHDVATQAQNWCLNGKSRGFIAPGFNGILYVATVWAINRPKQDVILRIDNFQGFDRCNITFPVQQVKHEAACRAVQNASAALAGENLWLRRMLFPETEDGVLQTTLSQATFEINWIDEILNWEQKKAIHSIMSTNYGNIPYLISGPPGTGKTKTLVELALHFLEDTSKRHNILVCAPSEAAADTLALRLSTHLQPHELFRLNSWTRTFAELPDRLLPFTYSDNNLFSLPPFLVMMSFRVVVTTCRDADMLVKARLTNSTLSALVDSLNNAVSGRTARQPLHWTAILLDEAAQATEPEVLIPLSVVMPPDEFEAPQFIAAGDQYQLGPKLLSHSGLEISLFQRLFEREAYAEHPLSRSKGLIPLTSRLLPMRRPAFTNLVRNYRSHPAILSIPSKLFYNDTLFPERRASQEVLSWPGWKSVDGWPVLFIQSRGEDAYESVTEGDGTGSGTLFNPKEAATVLYAAKNLLEHVDLQEGTTKLLQKNIMIMSPFRAQVNYLRKVFRENNLYDVNIGPLEAFQGLESRIVIICTTRTRVGSENPAHYVNVDKMRSLGIIDEPQRLNVAITRAQEGLIVVGNAHCLVSTGDRQWLAFLNLCKRNKCYDVPKGFQWPDLGGPHHPGRLERALKYVALGQAAAQGQTAAMHRGCASPSDGAANLRSSRFLLKGPRLDMDEEMWQYKELAQHRDSENVDLFGANDDAVDVDLVESTVSQTGLIDFNSDGSRGPVQLDNDYDRNIHKEFSEGCAAQ